MDCGRATQNEEFLAGFRQKVADRRVPLSGSLELTRRCNLRCVHCYQGRAAAGPDGRELSLGRWKNVLDQAADAGCLFLLLTGGEPLFRRDFADVYRYARELGMVVTVFSNATLVDDETVGLFREYPPFAVEVSINGARAETHDWVTGVPGSFSRAMQGIDKLADAGVCVSLKTVVLSINQREIASIERMAGEKGLRFRMDAAVFPTLSGDQGPCAHRAPPEEAAAIELSSPARKRDWMGYHERCAGAAPGDKLYECGAALGSFYVDAEGRMFPCLMARSVSADLARLSFAEGWEQVGKIREIPAPESFVCNTCRTRAYCDCCPAFFSLENGDETQPSEFVCRLGQARVKEILCGNQ